MLEMLHFYVVLSEQFKWEKDVEKIQHMKEKNQEKITALKAKIKDAEENLGESDVREAMLAEADHYSSSLDKDSAVSAYRETLEKSIGLGEKLDIIFTLIRIGLFWRDESLILRNIEKAKELMVTGGDWDRKNRLKAYEGDEYEL
jgi:26S proteasome regulatory subunit N7